MSRVFITTTAAALLWRKRKHTIGRIASVAVALLATAGVANAGLIDFEDQTPEEAISGAGFTNADKVNVWSPDEALIWDLNDGVQKKAVALWPMHVYFSFLDLPASEVTATIGANNAPTTVTAFGTEGKASFEIQNPWLPGTTETLSGIGEIRRVGVFGYEGWVDDFSYTLVPEPAALAYLAVALSCLAVGQLAGLRRRFRSSTCTYSAP